MRPSLGTTTRTGYGLLAIADTLLAGSRAPAASRLRRVTKPLLMPVLSLAFTATAAGAPDRAGSGTPHQAEVGSDRRLRRLRRTALAAQAFSWGGDVALLGVSKRAFLTGVASFFGAHCCYVTGFASARDIVGARDAVGPRDDADEDVRPGTDARDRIARWGPRGALTAWLLLGPLLSVAAGGKDAALRLPIGVYTGALCAMFAASTSLDPSLSDAGRRKIMAGTSLFLISDTVLGVREFLLEGRSPALDSLVMATYTAGQWLIADGVNQLG